MTDSATPPVTSWRPGIVLALVCLPVFIGALDLTIVSAVLPNVIVDLRIPFQTGANDAAWMVSGYLLAYTVSVAIMGRVSDLIGRRRTYFLALLIFILGSWLVAIATLAPAGWMRSLFQLLGDPRPDRAYMALYALIAGRVVQALGAGAMVPVSMALVGDLYPPGRRAMPLGVVAAVDTAGWVLGHLYGGVMVQFVSWPVLFWLNIPITTIVALITWRQLAPIARSHDEGGLARPAWGVVVAAGVILNLLAMGAILQAVIPAGLSALSPLFALRWLSLLIVVLMLTAIILTLTAARRISEDHSINWPGAVLISLALIGLNIGLGGGSEASPGLDLAAGPVLPPYAAFALIGSVLALAGFILIERRSQHPLFDLSYFRIRNISLAAGINVLVGFCLMVGLVSVPLFVNAVIAATLDEAALLSGLLLGTLTIPMALASVPGGLITERLGYRIPTTVGMALAAVGFFLGRTWTPDVSQTTMGLHMALAGIGLGLTVAPIGTTVINSVRSAERGVASALVLIMRLIGMTFGTSVMASYGLRRSNILTEQLVSALGESVDMAALIDIAHQVATSVISEMMLIAAVLCLVALIPALLLRPRDTGL